MHSVRIKYVSKWSWSWLNYYTWLRDKCGLPQVPNTVHSKVYGRRTKEKPNSYSGITRVVAIN